MKHLFSSAAVLFLPCLLKLSVCADVITPPQTPIDKMGEAGGPLLIILALVVLPLAIIVGGVYLVSWLIRKLVKKIKNNRR